MACLGFFMVSTLVSCNTLVQTLVDEDKRNRVMSLFIVCAMGITPIGSLNAGWLATHIGVPPPSSPAGSQPRHRPAAPPGVAVHVGSLRAGLPAEKSPVSPLCPDPRYNREEENT